MDGFGFPPRDCCCCLDLPGDDGDDTDCETLYGLKTLFTPNMALLEFHNNMTVIIILKICTEFPDIHNMNACIGMDLAGARATSQAFCV